MKHSAEKIGPDCTSYLIKGCLFRFKAFLINYNNLVFLTPFACGSLIFFMKRPQIVVVGHHLPLSFTLCKGTPHGCVLSACLYSLFTDDCRASHNLCP